MHTLKVKVRTDKDGMFRLEIPTHIVERELEVVLVMQPVSDEPIDDMGYPIGYFDETYGSFADDPLERSQPPQPDVRDAIE
jgi:hypothetical protein